MALVKRSNSKFWYVQFQINHITIIRSTRTTDRKVAERVAAKIRSEAHEQLVLGQKKPLTIEQALERFIGVDPSELPDNLKLKQKTGPPKRPPGVDVRPIRPRGKAAKPG